MAYVIICAANFLYGVKKMINHIIDGELDILVQAYRNEKKEIQKYNIGLKAFKDERSQDFFTKMIKDETLHMKMIRKHIEEIDTDFFKKFSDPEIIILKPNDAIKDGLKPIDFLKYSLFEEKMGAVFHYCVAKELKLKPLKDMFTELEAAEVAHINAIRYEIDYLAKNS